VAQHITLATRLGTPEIDGKNAVGDESERGNKKTVHFYQDVLDFPNSTPNL
jgi:hypothetical protein